MAWSTASVSANELSAQTAGYPAFFGNSVLERSQAEAQWRASGSWASGTNITDSAGPGRLAYDRRQKNQTYPTSAGISAVSAVSLIFDLSASTIASANFDMVGIFGHNFNSVTNLTGVYIEIADDNAFTTRMVAVTSWTSASDWGTSDTLRPVRLIDTNITDGVSGNQRITGLTYVRVRLTASSSFTVVPKIGEVWLGRRQQMTMHGNLPFSERPLTSSSADFVTESGDVIRHSLYSGAANREIEFTLGGTVLYDPETELREWQNQTSYGQKSFVYVEDMNTVDTDRRAWMMMQDPPEFVIEKEGLYEGTLTIGMLELPPYVIAET